ncbi:hypothetical protein PG994_001401 [Apiospora phragmitis]|uniref:Uncharacterized protein n=1 Tax=Apiospora phragmitis TaxID=2905665 RepID=A0ABR1WTG1_9PEZI
MTDHDRPKRGSDSKRWLGRPVVQQCLHKQAANWDPILLMALCETLYKKSSTKECRQKAAA